jgi:histidinol-phosphate aminotransferase
MKQFWSSRARGMTPYTPGEQPKDRKFIKLNTNENPYPPSPAVAEAIRAAAGEGLRLYPDPEGTRLRETVARTYGLKPEQVFVGNGSDEVLAMCFQAFFDPERTILFPDVTYSFYPVYAQLFGLNYRQVPLDENFALPLDAFLGNNGGVVLANPNAPTGREVSVRAIQTLLEGNPEAVVLVDEAYVDFGAASAVELIDRYPNLVVVQTMSKSRSLAGLRVGFAMGDADLIAALDTVKNSFNSYTLDRLALAGGEAALEDEAYFRATTAKIISTRDKTADRLQAMGFTMCDSSANFLFISHPNVPAKQLMDGLRERGILVRWWDKPRISNYLRVSVGTDEDMDALCRALEELIV